VVKQSVDKLSSGPVLFVGLGNPGPKYVETRHNIGFMAVDHWASRWRIDMSRQRFKAFIGQGMATGRRVCMLKPQTYMNLSGQSVSRAASFYDMSVGSLVVAHDDIDLPFGSIRLKRGGGAGGHKGLKSIDELMGDRGYFRLRLGVGRPVHGDVSNFVLKRFDTQERAEIEDWLEGASSAFEMLLNEGLKATQNKFHGSGQKK
jgi:PTH1 family peptidyl-tRNA hydrolase